MPLIDIEILSPFCAQAMEGTKLTPAERGEVLRIAQGFACKDAAAAAGISPETIRARRKRIYRKLDVAGSNEVISSLLARAVKMLARGEKLQPTTATSTGTSATTVASEPARASSVG
jgi:DNA-binding CsgD family transcriptional regulator